MTRDDRDIESANPSKSFKVGDFDRLSGFFTPVWESKRRIRSESPIPSSGPASSKSGAPKAGAKPTPSKGVAAQATPEKQAPPAQPTTSPAPTQKAAAAAPQPPAAATDSAAAALPKVDTAATPAPPAATSAQASNGGTAQAAPAGSTAAAALGATSQQPKTLAKPSAAAPRPAASIAAAPRASVKALEQAGPNLPAEAFLDPKPDFRIPLSKSTPAPQAERINTARQRSVRASVAATRVHEQLRARAEAESFAAPELQWGTETDLEALASPASSTAAASDDPYPLHLLRRLRRTIHLATPLPESVREMIARYVRS